MKLIQIRDNAHWHELRARHIGGSEVAALFDLSPWATKYTLWHGKRGDAPMPEEEDERMAWGRRLEPAIAAGIADEMRWIVEERQVYAESIDEPGMGCTVDRWITDHERGPGVLEIKNLDYLRWRDTWTETHAAPSVELQLQQGLAVTGFTWGAIGALVGGNKLVIHERSPHLPTHERIKEAVADFWASIEDNEPPDPFGAAAELDTLNALCNPPDPEMPPADLTGDAEAFEAARMFQWSSREHHFHEKTRAAARVKLLHKIGRAQKIILPGFDIRRSKMGHLYKCEMLPGAEAPGEMKELFL